MTWKEITVTRDVRCDYCGVIHKNQPIKILQRTREEQVSRLFRKDKTKEVKERDIVWRCSFCANLRGGFRDLTHLIAGQDYKEFSELKKEADSDE